MQEQQNRFDSMNDMTDQIKSDVEKLVEGFDLETIAKRVDEFGHRNPVGLALAALSVGFAVGMFMRDRPLKF